MKSQQHLNSSLLQKVARGDFREEELRPFVEHIKGCAHCQKLIETALPDTRDFLLVSTKEAEGDVRYELESYSDVFNSLVDRLSEESSRLDSERYSAPNLLRELADLPLERQQLLVRNSSKFQSWGFAEYLLDLSRGGWTEDPVHAERLALLAVEVTNNLSARGFRSKVANDLKAEAWSYVGNCRRIRSDLSGAHEAFGRAEELLESGTGDALERARVLDLKASLLRHQERYAEAQELLEFAISVYRSSGETRLEAKALLGFGKIFNDLGEAESCIPIVERAIDLLGEDGDHYLELVAGLQLIHNLTESGRAEEARVMLPAVRTLARAHGNRLDRLQLLWLEGQVCQSLGQTELAEETLEQARQGFMAAELGYEFAQVSLDLAMLYLECDRTAEVKRLALEILPQFAVTQIHWEALAAISLFKEAARKEGVSVAFAEEVAAKVRGCRDRGGSA